MDIFYELRMTGLASKQPMSFHKTVEGAKRAAEADHAELIADAMEWPAEDLAGTELFHAGELEWAIEQPTWMLGSRVLNDGPECWTAHVSPTSKYLIRERELQA